MGSISHAGIKTSCQPSIKYTIAIHFYFANLFTILVFWVQYLCWGMGGAGSSTDFDILIGVTTQSTRNFVMNTQDTVANHQIDG